MERFWWFFVGNLCALSPCFYLAPRAGYKDDIQPSENYLFFLISGVAEANTNANQFSIVGLLRILWIDSKLGGTTPARQFERTGLEAGEGSLEGVDGIGINHRLVSLLVRDDPARVDEFVSLSPSDSEVLQALFERDQPPARGRHFLRLARHRHVLDVTAAEYSRRRSRLNI